MKTFVRETNPATTLSAANNDNTEMITNPRYE